MKVATADDVARQLGISRSTVSRAFTPGSPVSARTRETIVKAAKEIGYQPNALARALISQRSQIIGIVTGDLSNPYHSYLQEQVIQSLQSTGLVPISLMASDQKTIEQAVPLLLQYQVACVVLTSIAVTDNMIKTFERAGLPVMLLNRIAPSNSSRAICADLEQGGFLAACHLASRECQNIAMVSGPPNTWTSQARESGFRAGLRRGKRKISKRVAGDYTYQSGIRAAHQVMTSEPAIDGVLCANDLMALGFIDGARELGIQAPRDFAVVGFDDIEMSSWSGYKLSTVRLPTAEMIRAATDYLVQVVTGQRVRGDTTLIPCELVVRAT